MSVLLYVVGALCVVCGAAAIFFGIPVKEFSFGDTLIGTGTTGLIGGLILIGLGAAVAQLQRIAEFLGARPLARAGQPVEPAVRLGAGRVPFPPKPKVEPRERPPEMAVMPQPPAKASETEFAVPPSLHNPDVPLMAEEEAEELPLSPRTERHAADARAVPEPKQPSEPEAFEPEEQSSPPRPAQPSYFENMWPAAERNQPPPEEPVPARAESIPRVPEMDEMEPVADEPQEEVQPVAVLKSGVVDGMGYTLYVDGSIEAELPDGTLRFASINELRAHLEKNS